MNTFSAPFISVAGPADAAHLSQLVNSAYRGDGSKKGWTTEADLLGGQRTNEAGIREMLAEPDAVILKYTSEEGLLQGCVYLKKKATSLYLGMLTVSPELQAKGIGKQLLAAAESMARQAGCNTVEMTVISVRKELIAWYERHGYAPTGETAPFPSDPKFGLPKLSLEFIVLKKKLP
jgi:GNAT superfamily N-acetyltransferase